jgi:predicted RNA-binding protein with PIN domain
VPDRALQSALELAVGIAAAGVKLRPPLAFPPALKKFLKFHKLPPAALTEVRAAVEADDGFRRRLALVATSELVDEIGMLWLARPDGWSEAIAELLPTKLDDDEAQIRRESRRRLAAEDSAARAHAEVLSLTADLEREHVARGMLSAESDRLRVELDDVRRRLREAQRAEHATAQMLAKVEGELLEARRVNGDSQVESGGEVPSTSIVESSVIDTAAVRGLIDGALSAAAEVARLLREAMGEVALADRTAVAPPPRQVRPPRRKAVGLPGGMRAGSVEADEFLLRTAGAQVLVDGYNVAKLGWPSLDLDHQRDQCIVAAENLAKRWNIAMTIVFDGATIEGAHASKRRRVRIVYSPEGVTADDVLRAEVACIGREHPVVVVTNDRAIINDVVAVGANTVSSDDFLVLTRR